MVALLIIAALLSLPRIAVAQPGQVLFRADFNDLPEGKAPGASWKDGGDQVVVRDGRLFVGSEKWNPVVTLDKEFSGDLEVGIDLRNAGECHWTGIVFKDVYWFTVNRQFGTFSCAKRVGNEPAKELAVRPSYAEYVHDVRAFRMVIVQRGKHFTAALDGKVLLKFDDPTAPAAGHLQLVGGWGTKVAFDNLVVQRPESGSPVPVSKTSVAPAGFQVRGRLEHNDGIYYDGEPVHVAVAIDNQSKVAVAGTVEYRLVDYWEQTIDRVRRPLRIDAGGKTTDSLTFTPKQRGVFKVALYLPDGHGDLAWASDIISFGVIAQSIGETPPNPDSYFGAHPEQINADFHLAFMKKLGAKWVRCHDMIQMTRWKIIEPERGKWVWRDEQLATIRKYGYQVLGMFFQTPAWAARQAGNSDSLPPASWDDYAEYVRRMVTRWKGDIHDWEVWNEPHFSGFWRGTPEEYVKLLKVTYETVKQADPTCNIVGIGGIAMTNLQWLQRALAAGAVQWMDDLSTHGYVDATTPMSLLQTESYLPQFDALLKQYRFKGNLWDSEHSITGTSFIDDFRLDYVEPDAPYSYRTAAETMMKMFVFEVARGYKHIFPYMTKWAQNWATEQAWREHPLNQNLFDVYGTPKPMAIAYATTAYMMESAKYSATLALDRYVNAYVYVRGNDTMVCYWGRFGRFHVENQLLMRPGVGVDLHAVERVDIMGNRHPLEMKDGTVTLPLSSEPVWIWFRGVNSDHTTAWLRNSRTARPIKLDFENLEEPHSTK